jgi:hypothetical protein
MARLYYYTSNKFNCTMGELELLIRGTRRICAFGLEWATVEVHFYFPYSSPPPLCSKFTSSKGYSKKSSEPSYIVCSRLGVSNTTTIRCTQATVKPDQCWNMSVCQRGTSAPFDGVASYARSPFLSTQLVLD